jgi:uncharacterized membrane protein
MHILIWMIGGALLGWLVLALPGVLFGGITGFLVGRAAALQERLENLERQFNVAVSGLKARISDLESGVPRADKETPQVEESAYRDTPEPSSWETSITAVHSEPGPEAQPPAREDETPGWYRPAETGAATGSDAGGFASGIGRKIIAWFTEGNPVVRIGIVILFFGVSFLIKYAAERNVFPIELRLASVALAATAVLVVGWRLRERHGGYGLVLQGGAVAALYLTAFGAAKLYGLLPLGLAFALITGLVALSGVLAVLQDARVLALFGAAGGFLAPILLSSGSGNHVALFSYYALLNAGIFGIAWFKSWRDLNLVGFLFTFVIGAAWGHENYRPEHFNTTEPFLILFFLFYATISVLFAHRQPPQLKGYIDASLVFGVPLAGFTLQSALIRDIEFGLAYSALAVATFYILLARALWKREPSGLRLLTEAFLSLGVVFASLTVPLALDGRWTATTWSFEGAALVWVGIHQNRRLARWFGLLLQFGAGCAFMISLDHVRPVYAFANGAYLGALAVSLAALFSSRQLYRHGDRLLPNEPALALPVFAWGLLWWFGAGLREVELNLSGLYEPYGILAFAALTALLSVWIGARLGWPWLSRVATVLLPLGIVISLALYDRHTHQHPAQYWGWWAFPAALVTHLWTLRKGASHWPRALEIPWHAGGLLWFLFLLAWQSAWGIDQLAAGGRGWPLLAWGAVPALSLLLLVKTGQRLPAPVKSVPDAYLGRGLAPLAAAILVWIFYGCIQEGDPSPLPYLPVVNPLDLVQLLCLYALVVWWKKTPEPGRDTVAALGPALPAAIALAAFAWLNALVARTVHFWSGVDFTASALHHSMTYQACLSVLWSTVALLVMVLASRRAQRVVWFTGSVILALVVLKLFVIDLSSSGTVARIVSFLAVGGFMLVIGYLSPLPPRRELEERS